MTAIIVIIILSRLIVMINVNIMQHDGNVFCSQWLKLEYNVQTFRPGFTDRLQIKPGLGFSLLWHPLFSVPDDGFVPSGHQGPMQTVCSVFFLACPITVNFTDSTDTALSYGWSWLVIGLGTVWLLGILCNAVEPSSNLAPNNSHAEHTL